MQATTTISGYLVELDTEGETTKCFVDFNDRGTHYNAPSLHSTLPASLRTPTAGRVASPRRRLSAS